MNKWMWLAGGVLLGIVFKDQVAKIPLVNKIPTL